MSYSRKVERLLESKRPSLSILLEDISPDDKKGLKKEKNDSKKEPKKPEPASKSSSSSKPEEKEEKLDFGSFNLDNEEEKQEDEDLEKEKGQNNQEEENKEKQNSEEEILKKAKDLIKRKDKVESAVESPLNLPEILDQKLFPENFFRKVGVSNSFRLQEKKIFMTNKKIIKEFSINDKVGDIDLSIDVLVSNAINLTRNFEDLIDIPDLILSHVSARFAEKAIEDENENASSEYRVKLEEFIEKYMSKLKTIDDYKNYDTSKYVISHNPQRPVATGARPST
jgi:hypothetical protein